MYMKIMTADQATTHVNGSHCVAREYPLGNEHINGAVVTVTGRYPEVGRVTNLKCTELAYVIAGKGGVVIEGVVQNLNQGDLLLIEPRKKYYWEGNLEMFISCVPSDCFCAPKLLHFWK